MAIKKSKETLGGQVTADYWRVIECSLQFAGSRVFAKGHFGLFSSKAKAEAQAPTLDVKIIEIELSEKELKQDPRDALYAALKQDAEFIGGEDV